MVFLPSHPSARKPRIRDHLNLICATLEELPLQPDTAAHVHVAAARALHRQGFDVEIEHQVSGGRIDIVATDGEWRCAIEIDARKPRGKSLIKLRNFIGAKVIALRGVTALLPSGIDAVVTIPVRTATSDEISDRRTASKFRAWK